MAQKFAYTQEVKMEKCTGKELIYSHPSFMYVYMSYVYEMRRILRSVFQFAIHIYGVSQSILTQK